MKAARCLGPLVQKERRGHGIMLGLDLQHRGLLHIVKVCMAPRVCRKMARHT